MITVNSSIWLMMIITVACALLTGHAEAVIYCNGDISIDEWDNNGNTRQYSENCSLIGVECIEGIGCDNTAIPIVQPFVVGGILFVIVFFIFAIRRKKRG
jgi:hypothetical protein